MAEVSLTVGNNCMALACIAGFMITLFSVALVSIAYQEKKKLLAPIICLALSLSMPLWGPFAFYACYSVGCKISSSIDRIDRPEKGKQ